MSAYSLEQWQQRAQMFAFAGLSFAYWQSEPVIDKPVLLLIHGFPSASWDWTPIWDSLAQHYHLIAADMLGFGLSSKACNANYSIDFQADMYQALLASLGVSRYRILAHDYGDTVAQELLARDIKAQHIECAFLLNGGLFPETHRALLVQKFMLTPLGFLTGRIINYRLFKKSFERICAKPFSENEMQTLWQLLRFNHGHKIMHKLIFYIRERQNKRHRWVGALQQTNAKLVLINGSQDPISGAHMVARYQELVSGEHIYELPDCGHYPQLENPQAVIDVVLKFTPL